jgi:hypothetical protein
MSSVQIGQSVRIVGLIDRPEYNRRIGKVVAVCPNGRVGVEVETRGGHNGPANIQIAIQPNRVVQLPVCGGCGKYPHQLQEYMDRVADGYHTPEDVVMSDEGTYNPSNMRFACTSCYIHVYGCPTAPGGWTVT